MITELQEEFVKNLASLDWMAEEDKQKAIKKVCLIQLISPVHSRHNQFHDL